MPRKKKTGRPDPKSRDYFYLLEVTGFSLAGGASSWYPDELPDIHDRNYRKKLERPLLHEDLRLHLELRPVDPLMPEVTDCSADLRGHEANPEPDYESFGGSITKRKERLNYWFQSTVNLPRDLASVLFAGRGVFIRFQGSRIYRGSAGLCGLEWWCGDHPDLLAELEDTDDHSP